MKRWVCLLAVLPLSLLCLCGCRGGGQTAQPVTEGFTCQATIRYGELDVAGQMTCHKEGKMAVAFTLPKSLQGVTLGYDGKQMTMTLGKMEMTLPADKVPDSGLIRCLAQTLTASHPKGEKTDRGIRITGESQGDAYVLLCDSETGYPLSLSIPSQGLEAVFSDCKALTQS